MVSGAKIALCYRCPVLLRSVLVGLCLFVSYAWFYQAGGWNQNSRFDLVRAIVERGTLKIDAYHENTGDKALFRGHYYSDKAPGLALFAVPGAAVARPLCGPRRAARYVGCLSYLTTLWAAALPMALAGMLLVWAFHTLGASLNGATVAAIAFGLGTPAWGYGTLLYGHALATSGIVAAWAAAVAIGSKEWAKYDVPLALSIGLSAGWATITEFPSAIPAAMLAGLAVRQTWHGDMRRVVRVAACVAGGGAAAGLVLVAYNTAVYGSPLQTGYAHVEGFDGMKVGVMGVTYPKLEALWGITFSPYRGLFFHAPVLFAAIAGWPLVLRALPRARRAAMLAGLAIAVYYLLFNAAYVYWDGGWSFGPRHVLAGVPFMALPLAWLWDRPSAFVRAGVLAVALVSVGMTLVVVSTTPQPPDEFSHPLKQLWWPAFASGDLSLNHSSFLDNSAVPRRLRGRSMPHDAWNLGELMGMRGLPSLAPLVIILMALGAMALSRQDERAERP